MEKKKKVSLLFQVAMLFIIGVIVIGTLSTFALYIFSTRYVMERLESSGNSTADDLKGFIYDYPTHEWLLRYWYEHYDELDIEYDGVLAGVCEH